MVLFHQVNSINVERKEALECSREEQSAEAVSIIL